MWANINEEKHNTQQMQYTMNFIDLACFVC